jgi:ABC-2 type transport system ATP-binding protein
MLEVQQLTKLYGRRIAVDEVTFNVSAGEIVGYLGPNGAGKSTTVKMLVALLQPSAGQILFRGCPIQDCLLDFKQRLGYVPEEAILYSHLSGYEFLLLVGRLRGIRESALIQKIESLLKVCLLNPYKHSPIASYSKGMKQKIMMLAALLHDPDVLVLDEPFSGLDVSSILIFRRLLRSLAAAGKAILLSSHDLEITEKICSRVLVIYKSRLVANDSVENLRHTMKLSSLEEVFQQLVEQEDYDKAADEILSIVHA